MEEKIDYDNLHVFYCEHCLSLNIKDGGFIDFCEHCGGTEIAQCDNIYEWKALYRKRFNKEFSDYKKD